MLKRLGFCLSCIRLDDCLEKLEHKVERKVGLKAPKADMVVFSRISTAMDSTTTRDSNMAVWVWAEV